jgi:hypothetical protein
MRRANMRRVHEKSKRGEEDIDNNYIINEEQRELTAHQQS